MREPERLEIVVGQAAGEGAVAHDGDHMPPAVFGVVAAVDTESRCHAVGVGQGGGGMGVLDEVVLGLAAIGVARQPHFLLEPLETRPTSRQQLVHVCLVPCVEEQQVAR